VVELVERYLTEDLPGIGGVIKEQVEDFLVEELPLYAPSGQGQHTFFEIRKEGLSTFQAVQAIARALQVPPNSIGYAGIKDARAVTSQMLSVEGVSPEAVTALDLPHIQVLWAKRHRNRLKIGHLSGNRFTIRIRGVNGSALAPCQAILDLLQRRGVPNRFGPQRFGQRGDSARLGQAVLRKDAQAFIGSFLGGPDLHESQAVQEARRRFDAGDWQGALNLFPPNMSDERRALQALIEAQGDHRRAYGAVPKRLKMFLVSAYQSELFNRVLDARLDTLDRVYVGDVAMKHPGHSVFRVQDEAADQVRAANFEISPTGPMYGYKMMQAAGRQGALEAEILAAEGLALESFRVGEGVKAPGERRALRFQMYEPEVWFDEGIMLRFRLLAGCYATALLAEIMKVPLDPA
jgi:tRNA pseudouridine13 synthase